MGRINACLCFLFLISSCGRVATPKQSDYKMNRNFTESPVNIKAEAEIIDFKELFDKGYKASKEMKPSDFEDKFFHKYNGGSNLFMLKSSAEKVGYLDMDKGEGVGMKITSDNPFGLVIGQSKTKLYYYMGTDRGKSFYVYAFEDGSSKKISIADFIIINLVEIPNSNTILASGVHKRDGRPTLGLYKIDLNRSLVVESVREEELAKIPDGEPSVYGGQFYQYKNDILFAFNKRSSIYQLNKDGDFVRKIETPDIYVFPKETPINGCVEGFDNMNLNMFVKDRTLYTLTRYLDSKNKTLYFDTYDLEKGVYLTSWPLVLDFDEEEYIFNRKLSFQTGNIINLLFPSSKTPGVYMNQKIEMGYCNNLSM